MISGNDKTTMLALAHSKLVHQRSIVSEFHSKAKAEIKGLRLSVI